MTDKEIQADRDVIAAATEGNWGVCDFEYCDGFLIGVDEGAYGQFFVQADSKEDATFIAQARTRWPAALDEVERLQDEVERRRAGIKYQEAEIRELKAAPQKSAEPAPASDRPVLERLISEWRETCDFTDHDAETNYTHELLNQAFNAGAESVQPACFLCGGDGCLDGGSLGGLIECDCRIQSETAPSPVDMRALWSYADSGAELDRDAARRLYLAFRGESGVE